MLNEHRMIERSIAEFRESHGEDLPERLQKFGDLLEQHIRKEDRVLFPLLEEQAPPAVLDQVEKLINPYYEQ
ncbi:MAG: hemerythrin domain-containing protein [Bacteroidota bacterium]